jgi:hypothetical protein
MSSLNYIAVFSALIIGGCSSRSRDPSFQLAAEWDGSLHTAIPKPIRTALLQASDLELCSLDPKYRDEAQPKEFERRKVIGKTVISDANTRQRLLATINRGVAEAIDATGPRGATCFDPRQAIRVKHDDKTFYILVCFECNNVYTYVNEKLDRKLYFPISDSPLVTFKLLLSERGLPLADPWLAE